MKPLNLDQMLPLIHNFIAKSLSWLALENVLA